MTDSTTRIEEDLRVTRARMDGRLTELQERLTPGQILDDVMAYFRESGGSDFGRNLVTSVRDNPLPAAVTGIGLAWLMVSNAAGVGNPTLPRENPGPQDWARRQHSDLDLRLAEAERSVMRDESEAEETWRSRLDVARGAVLGVTRETSETAESFGLRVADAIAKAKEAVMGKVHDMQDQAAAAGGKAKQSVMEKVHDFQDQAADAGGRVSAMAQQAGDSVAEGGRRAREAGSKIITTMGENPLLLGAVALGFGALLGALIPQSEQEEAALADAGAKIRETALTAAQGVMDRGSQVADQALAAGQRSANARGLSGDTSVGELIDHARSGDLLDQVEGVARDTLQSTKTALREGQDSPDAQREKAS